MRPPRHGLHFLNVKKNHLKQGIMARCSRRIFMEMAAGRAYNRKERGTFP